MENIKPKRNLPDKEALEKYKQKQKEMSLIDTEIIQQRILENIALWETMITKHHNSEYVPQIAKFIKTNQNVRLLIKTQSAEKNEKLGYMFAKHLINSGVNPNKITIIDIDECYLHYRGFGEQGQKIRNNVFSDELEAIIFTNIADNRKTNVQDNVESFWHELTNKMLKNIKLHIILCFNTTESEKWFFQSKEIKEKIKQINFKII